MQNMQKCAIIGCGFVGTSTAFSLANSGAVSEIVLIDADTKKAEGEAMDLGHALPFLSPINIYAGSYSDLKDCGIVIIAAGSGRKKGMSRLELLDANMNILRHIIQGIVTYNTECMLVLLSNPVDILTYAAIKLSGLPENRVIGSGTLLDTARLKYQIGKHLNIDMRAVHALIIGEHGDSELPVWSSANISGCGLADFCQLSNGSHRMEDLKRIFEEVRTSGGEIITRKGATYYGIGAATTRIVESIIYNQHSVLPLSTMIHNYYDIHDVCFGIPAILGSTGIERIIRMPLDQQEQLALTQSAEKLKSVISHLSL